MTISYDRRKAAWDASILGITDAQLAMLTPEERAEFITDSLFRAADLAHEIMRAFTTDLSNADRATILTAWKALQGIARRR